MTSASGLQGGQDLPDVKNQETAPYLDLATMAIDMAHPKPRRKMHSMSGMSELRSPLSPALQTTLFLPYPVNLNSF